MVSQSRTRVSRLVGAALYPKIGWFLRRRARPPVRRRRQRQDPNDYWLPGPDHRMVRERYHLRGRQVRRACAEAARRPGDTGDNLIEILEQRLDALVWRAGFARTIRRARHLIGHRHVVVDGQPVDRPSYQLRPGQTIAIRSSRLGKACLVVGAQERAGRQPAPPYLDIRPDELRATLIRDARRTEAPGSASEPISVHVVTAAAA